MSATLGASASPKDAHTRLVSIALGVTNETRTQLVRLVPGVPMLSPEMRGDTTADACELQPARTIGPSPRNRFNVARYYPAVT